MTTASGLDDGFGPPDDQKPERRRVDLTPASAIKPRRARWLWDGRIAVGTLALLAGREGLGKSTLAYWIAAQVTRGTLPGEHAGTPRAVLVCATEDSWEHTIVPRLMAAGADLDRVYRIDMLDGDDLRIGLSLPRDLQQLEAAASETDAALLLLDPLMSRLSEKIDTHRDAETRRALEPLAATADRVGMSILGLIHHNKSGTADPLTAIMGSKAFTSVARSVHTVVTDPDDDTDQRRVFGTPKNNLGSTNLPSLAFKIVGHRVDTEEGPTTTGKVEWLGEASGTVADAMRRAGDPSEDRSAAAEAAEWLADYLSARSGVGPSAEIKAAAKRAGHSDFAMRRARQKLGIVAESSGYPRQTYWSLPSTELTAPTDEHTDASDGSVVSVPSPVARSVVSVSPRGECTTNTTNMTEGISPSRDGRVGRAVSSGGTDTTGDLTAVPAGVRGAQ